MIMMICSGNRIWPKCNQWWPRQDRGCFRLWTSSVVWLRNGKLWIPNDSLYNKADLWTERSCYCSKYVSCNSFL